MQSNKRQRVDGNNGGRKSIGDGSRKKQYSIVDTKWQPCATAYQSDDANVQLDFNFWMTHRQISDEDIVSYLLSVICRDSSQKSFLLSPATLKHVLLVGIHNISPIVVSDAITDLSFLRSCSSVPIHHTLVPDVQTRNNLSTEDIVWKYYDTAPMSAMLFWTNIYPLSSSVTEKKEVLELFGSFRLKFQITADNGGDVIGFIKDDTVTSRSSFAAIASTVDNSTPRVTGCFSLERDGDRGIFTVTDTLLVLFSDITNKLYVWEKICHKAHHDAHSNGFPYELLYDKQPLKYKLRDAEVYMTYDFASDSVYPTELWPRRPFNRCALLESVLSEKNSETSDQSSEKSEDTSNKYAANLQHIYFQYETRKAALGKLVASSDVLDLLGYPPMVAPPVTADTEDGELIESGEEDEGGDIETAYLEVAALDCEMCCTSAGMEVTRVTVVCPKAGVVLDTLVLPKRPIIDYNTEFSGITAEKLKNVTTTLSDVRKRLSQLIGPNTIVITHSGDGDFKVLHFSHPRIIDTAALFPHPSGLPYKMSLKDLAKMHLNQDVQASACGHDSIEDSLITLELALFKAGGHDEVPLPWTTPNGILEKHTLFHEAHLRLQFSQEDSMISHMFLNCSSPYAFSAKWVQHALGYKAEANPVTASETYQRSNNSVFKIYASQCESPSEAVKMTIKQMQEHSAEHKALWYTDVHHNHSDISEIDSSLSALYAAAPNDTLMVAITQGDIAALRLLMARKQRVKWQMNASSLKQQYADVKAVYWTEADEAELIREAAHVIAGAVFMKYKTNN